MKKLLILLILLPVLAMGQFDDISIDIFNYKYDLVAIGARVPYLLIEGDTSQLFIGNPNDTIIIGGTMGEGSNIA